jgi:hypothetical protein
VLPSWPVEGGSPLLERLRCDGASRTRTGDLLGAIQKRDISKPASQAGFRGLAGMKPFGYPALARELWG